MALGSSSITCFRHLEGRYANIVTLAFPNPDKPYILHTDASDFATGVTLSRMEEQGILRLIAGMSKKFSPVEAKYPAHERELLALVQALQH